MATKPASGTTPASRAAARAAGQPTTYTARKNAGLVSGSSGPNLIDASKRVVESKDSQIESITSQAQQIQGAINKLSTETPENIAQPDLTAQPGAQQGVPPGQPTVPFAQAQQALRSSGAFSGQALTNAENSLADTYRRAGMLANQSGVPAPQGQGAGASGAQQFTGAVTVAPETPSILGGVQEVDSMFDSLFVQFDDFYSPVKQKTSLVEEYSKLSQSLGIESLNAELIDAKRIIEGTEDDIRAEVTATGGMATESQVLALANARNKSLIKNYNYLLDTKNAAMEQLGTMMELTIADREAAAKEFDTKMNFAFKVAEFKERATTNARNTYMTLGEKIGWDTLLSGLSSYEQGVLQKTLGVSSQALSQLATVSAQQRALEGQENAMDNAIKAQQLYNLKLVGREAERKLGMGTSGISGLPAVPTTSLSLSKAFGDIQQIDQLTRASGISSAVGTTGLTRSGAGKLTTALGGAAVGAAGGSLFGPIGTVVGGVSGLIAGLYAGSPREITGQRQEFVGGVEQVMSKLNLDTLIQAKAEGATFGALSDQELRVLSTAGTTLGSYAIKDDNGKITGFNASEKSFKKEMDTINYYAKLDYILKGGAPEDVGAVIQPDGTVWIRDSFGKPVQLQ